MSMVKPGGPGLPFPASSGSPAKAGNRRRCNRLILNAFCDLPPRLLPSFCLCPRHGPQATRPHPVVDIYLTHWGIESGNLPLSSVCIPHDQSSPTRWTAFPKGQDEEKHEHISHIVPSRAMGTGFVTGRTLQKQRLGKESDITPSGIIGPDCRSVRRRKSERCRRPKLSGTGHGSAGILPCPFYSLLDSFLP